LLGGDYGLDVMAPSPTERTAISLVIEKLRANGYEVVDKNIERMNNPIFDLVAMKPGVKIYVDVKGQERAGPFWGTIKPDRPNLFYIFVIISSGEFFILSQDEFNTRVREYHAKHPDKEESGFLWRGQRKKTHPFPMDHFKDQWHKLPGWNA